MDVASFALLGGVIHLQKQCWRKATALLRSSNKRLVDGLYCEVVALLLVIRASV